MDKQLFQDVIDNCETLIETCNLISTRMVDSYVCMMPDGMVLTKSGITDFPVKFGSEVERSRSKAAVTLFLKQVKQQNPDNPSVQQLKVSTIKKAARLQRQKTYDILATLNERISS